MSEKPNYGNWVPMRLVYLPCLVALVFLGFAFLLQILVIPAVFFFLVFAYFAYARHLFAAEGGDLQGRVLDLVLERLNWNGEGQALDIGCGNGALVVKLARKYPNTQVTGIDYWGERWEYSKDVCEKNAKIAGVDQRVTFQKASASKLPFESEHFDAAVSNFVFHEVSDTADKREVIKEALRVVKKGGKFAFQDEFLMKRMYGSTDDLIKFVQSLGVTKVDFVQTRDAQFIPRAMKLPFMLGDMGMIAGEK